MTWQMWAHDRRGEFQHLGERWWVELHGFPDPIVAVDVVEVEPDSPEGTHWGWVGAGSPADGVPGMIWAHRGTFDMQFPYGPGVEELRGAGRVVRLCVTAREAAGDES